MCRNNFHRLRLLLLGLSLNAVYLCANADTLDSDGPASSNTKLSSQSNIPDRTDTPIQLAAAIGTPPTSKKPITVRPDPEIVFDDEKNLRLLELHIRHYNLKELITAYQYRDMILVPLGFLSELIDLAITVDQGKNTAEGFIFKENRTFNLDPERAEVTIEGKLNKYDAERVVIRELDDIYIDSRLLSEWLYLQLDIDLFQSVLKIISDEPLPFEKRKLREQKIKYARSRLIKQDRGYPKHFDPPKNWDYPMVDQTINLGLIRSHGGDFESSFNYSTFATADLFQMDSSWYLTGSDDDLLADSRVIFSKKDPDGMLLGPAKATEYSFGHITESRFDHVTRTSSSEPGVLIKNYPLRRQLEYDRHQFIGDLLPGWEVELYRNNALLDYQTSGEGGQYRFEDVPLLFGSNHFRLVFYGPQGQQREETYTFNLDSSLTQPGAYYYRASIMKDEKSGSRTIINSDLGINKQFSASFGFASIPVEELFTVNPSYKQHNYLKAGIRGFQDQFFYRADFTKDLQSGSNLDWNIQTRINSSLIRFGEIYFQSDFESELFPASQISIKRRSNIKYDTFISSTTFNNIPVKFEYNRDAFSSGITSQQFSNRFSLHAHGYAFSNTLSMNKLSNSDDTVTDTMQLSSRKFGVNTRGVLNYLIKPESELASISVTFDGFKLWDHFATVGLSRAFQSETDTASFSLRRSHGKYTLGASTTYSTGGIVTANLTISAGIGREPRTGQWQTEFRPHAAQGSISTQIYLDENANGEKDGEEKGLENIALRINGSKIHQKTDEQGIAYITGLETYRELDFDISEDTLEDPLWNSLVKGKRLLLRPGHTTLLDFPIVITGEIDGTVYAVLNGREQAVSGVIIELVDLDGRVVQTTKTEYDGFYLLSKIPLDTYTVRVSPAQIEELNLEPVKPEAITLDKDNQIINGIDLKLKKLSKEETRKQDENVPQNKDVTERTDGPDSQVQTQKP